MLGTFVIGRLAACALKAQIERRADLEAAAQQ